MSLFALLISPKNKYQRRAFMKRRIVSLFLTLLLVLAMLFSFASCSLNGGSDDDKDDDNDITDSSDSVQSKLNRALSSIENADSYEMNLSFELEMFAQGRVINMPVLITVKAKDATSLNPIGLMTMEMSIYGQGIEILSYYEDGISYTVTSEGEKYKEIIEDNETGMNEASLEDILKDLPASTLDASQITSNGNTTTIDIVFSQQDIQNYSDVIIEAMALNGQFESINIQAFETSVEIKGNTLSKMDISLDMYLSMSGVLMQATIDGTLEYSNINGNVTITPPNGYKSFPLYSEEDIIPPGAA